MDIQLILAKLKLAALDSPTRKASVQVGEYSVSLTLSASDARYQRERYELDGQAVTRTALKQLFKK